MKKKNIALSIIIPTHNRADYCIWAIRAVLSLKSKRLQLVVSDTSHSDRLLRMLKSNATIWNDDRLDYSKDSSGLDMTGNHNRAVSLARGDYVCLIGDDDAVSSAILDATNWAQERDILAIAPRVKANYVWGDFRTVAFGGAHAERLYLPRRVEGVSPVDPRRSLARCLRDGAQGTDGLPKLYHGLVRRDVLEEVRSLTGAYFHGSSPDISSAVAIARVLSRRGELFYEVGFPVTLPGASGNSNTGRSATAKHVGSLQSERQTEGFVESGWSQGIPRFFSVETVWAHSAVETLQRLGKDVRKSFNFERLLAICSLKHPTYRREIHSAIVEVAKLRKVPERLLRTQIRLELVQLVARSVATRSMRMLIPTAAGGRKYRNQVPDVAVAKSVLDRYLAFRRWTWSSVCGNQTVFSSLHEQTRSI